MKDLNTIKELHDFTNLYQIEWLLPWPFNTKKNGRSYLILKKKKLRIKISMLGASSIQNMNMISTYSTLIIINSKSEFGYIYLQYIQMSIAYNISNQTIYSEGEEMSSDKNPNGTMVFPLILYGSSQGQNCHWPQLLLNTI